MVAAEQRVGEERPLDLLAPNRPEDSRGRDALVNVEADGVDVEARVLRLAGPDELGVLVRVIRVGHLAGRGSILRGKSGLRDVRAARLRMPVISDPVLVNWGRNRG